MSLSVNVVLGHERAYRSSLRSPHPVAGTVLNSLQVLSAAGTPATLTWDERPMVLYYFHPDCRWCERNANSVAALERLTRGTYRFAAVTTAEWTLGRRSL